MADFVLDACVALTWAFPGDPTENTPYSVQILSKLIIDNAVVPEIWGYEIAHILYKKFKAGHISQQQIEEYLQLLKALPIRAESSDLWTKVNLESEARKWDLAAYDAAYLQLALSKRLPLATTDTNLKKTAESQGVQLLV